MSDKIIQLKSKSIKPVEIKKGEFDFDYWSKLAKQDPDAFEAAREAEINKHIASLGDEATQERMRRLQWRVEMERKRSSSPLDAAARIYDMMWDSVGSNIKALDELVELVSPYQKSKVKSGPVGSARIERSQKAAKTNRKDETVLVFKRKEAVEIATAE